MTACRAANAFFPLLPTAYRPERGVFLDFFPFACHNDIDIFLLGNRKENGMKYRRMWLFALLAAALMLLCGAQAIAEKMTPVPAERIRNVTLPEGVVLIGDPVIAEGKVTVYVDDDKTNWTEVLLKAASRDIIDAKLTVDAPFADAAKGVQENFGNGDIYTLPAISEGVVPAWFAENYPPDKISENSLKSSVVFAEVSILSLIHI